jgi:hypothetical protein
MKFYIYCLSVLGVVSCTSKSEKGKVVTTTTPTSTPVAAAAPQAAVPLVAAPKTASVSADCQRKGAVIAKFEQNNAVFERLQNDKKTQEWLKITAKDGSCKIIDSLADANHDSVRFEDWDKDGLKDRINESKWFYEVALFNPKTNDFSRSIEGSFSGEQSDYDKARGLRTQFMENKRGGTYELYKISDLKKVVYCQISVEEGDGETPNIEVVNKKGATEASPTRMVIKTDPSLLKAAKPVNGEDSEVASKRLKAAIEAYWRKNEAVFLPK